MYKIPNLSRPAPVLNQFGAQCRGRIRRLSCHVNHPWSCCIHWLRFAWFRTSSLYFVVDSWMNTPAPTTTFPDYFRSWIEQGRFLYSNFGLMSRCMLLPFGLSCDFLISTVFMSIWIIEKSPHLPKWYWTPRYGDVANNAWNCVITRLRFCRQNTGRWQNYQGV